MQVRFNQAFFLQNINQEGQSCWTIVNLDQKENSGIWKFPDLFNCEAAMSFEIALNPNIFPQGSFLNPNIFPQASFWMLTYFLRDIVANDFGINPLLESKTCQGESRQQVRVKGEALEKLGEGFIADIQHLDVGKFGWSLDGVFRRLVDGF